MGGPFCLDDVVAGLKKKRNLSPRKCNRQPIYRKQDYIALIKKHYKECGLPEPSWLEDIPDPPPTPDPPERPTEPKLFSHDWLTLVLDYDEVHERVKCRMSVALHDLYRNHYSRGIPPPIETLVRAYKDLGFSDDYLMDLISKHDRRVTVMQKYGAQLDAIFKTDSAPKKKKAKEKKEVLLENDEQDEEENEEDEDDIIPGEDGNFDMEIEEDEDNVDDVEDEDYLSD